ncbi:MAG: GGDEF domain-containing protein [Clostridia bacterium]|nr:GGDEF domain-containing protein [Clostridia bacterium]
MDYYRLLEQLLHELNGMGNFDLQSLNSILAEMCRLLHVAKGVTSVYATPALELEGKGEHFICYDSGVSCHEELKERLLTPANMVVTCSAYHPDDAEPWTDIEVQRIQLIQKMIVSFLNRSRLSTVVERLSYYDDDGYRNLRYFVNRIETLGHAGRLGGMVVARFNLRHLSLVNHQVGRKAGTIAIQNYFEAVQSAAGENGLVCRMGGDNFVMMCSREAEENVLCVFHGYPVIYDTETNDRVTISATAGIYEVPSDYSFSGHGDIMDKIISSYQHGKLDGKESVVFYTEQMMDERENIMRIQQLFQPALEREEFLVYYQPKINVDNNDLAGAEALCRWQHKGRLVPPIEFIPVLEQNLDICKLDFYMLDHVCRDIRKWMNEGRRVVRVSVNLSRKHMIDADLFEHILEIVDRNHVPHEYIEIELTETTTDVAFRDLKRVVGELQSAGFYTSVDDFGIGYSSLNLIREIPWNVLKVDKSFLPAEKNDIASRSSIMFRHVVAMARELGLEGVAEGVETSEQVEILRKNCCTIAQGFYYDRPLPKEAFEDRLEHHVYPAF